MKNDQTLTPPLLAIFILSAAALSYEVLLIRLFSIIHWHHFAFMVISIALLGYGVSGSLISVFRQWLMKHYEVVFVVNILLFGLSSVGCFVIAQQLPFNALVILWDSSQWQRLLLSYLLLALPFFFVANAITLAMMRFDRYIPQLYGVDLIGAGAGALMVMLLLQLFSPQLLLTGVALGGILAGVLTLFVYNRQQHRRYRLLSSALLIIVIGAVLVMPQRWLEPQLSEYKGLTQTLQIKDTVLLQTHNSPVSRIDVVRSSLVPFRYAPGLSLQSPAGPPAQLAVFRDGDEMQVIDHVDNHSSLVYYDYLSSALPYHLHVSPQNVLVLGSATGSQILQAQLYAVPEIDAVEPDEQLSQLITQTFADYIGWPSISHKVHIHTMSTRGFAATAGKYDVIVYGPSGASSGSAAGVHELSESYDNTVEALQRYLKLLASDGMLSLTGWNSTPERSNLKLFIAAVTAMRNNGIVQPENNIAWIRSWNTSTLLLKNTALTAEQISRVRDFSNSRSFDLAWLPDIAQHEVNRFQLLPQPVYYLTARAVFENTADDYMDSYKYNIRPATDNRPYFNHSFKWSSLDELLSLPGRTGISMIGVGYPALLVTLAQAFIAAIILIVLPLVFIREKKQTAVHNRWSIILYFMAVGLAFLMIEIAFIQKFTLILGQPLYAVAVALCAFLIFSGLGSLYAQHRLDISGNGCNRRLLRHAVILIAVITLIYIVLLPMISDSVLAMREFMRIVSAFIIAAPLAFAMGMPFPLGLSALQQNAPQLIPWAWAINGCASVLSAILAVLLAMETGFNGVMLCAILLYLIAWFGYTAFADRRAVGLSPAAD